MFCHKFYMLYKNLIYEEVYLDMLNNKNSVYSRFKSHEAMVNYFLTHNGDEFVNFDDN